MALEDRVGKKVQVLEWRNNGHHQEEICHEGILLARDHNLVAVEVGARFDEAYADPVEKFDPGEVMWFNTTASTFRALKFWA